jgi:DNA-directed RNA polymerase subunit RPC12/RpoP
MAASPKPKRCSFCGSRRLVFADFSGPRGEAVQVDCAKCGSSGPLVFYDYQQPDKRRRAAGKRAAEGHAVRLWNERAFA